MGGKQQSPFEIGCYGTVKPPEVILEPAIHHHDASLPRTVPGILFDGTRPHAGPVREGEEFSVIQDKTIRPLEAVHREAMREKGGQVNDDCILNARDDRECQLFADHTGGLRGQRSCLLVMCIVALGVV
jgi:hypothetical protein